MGLNTHEKNLILLWICVEIAIYNKNYIKMSKKKHIMDWFIENTPSDEKEYERGCLSAFSIVAIIFIVLVITLLITIR